MTTRAITGRGAVMSSVPIAVDGFKGLAPDIDGISTFQAQAQSTPLQFPSASSSSPSSWRHHHNLNHHSTDSTLLLTSQSHSQYTTTSSPLDLISRFLKARLYSNSSPLLNPQGNLRLLSSSNGTAANNIIRPEHRQGQQPPPLVAHHHFSSFPSSFPFSTLNASPNLGQAAVSSAADHINWDSVEMMTFLNETLLGSSSRFSSGNDSPWNWSNTAAASAAADLNDNRPYFGDFFAAFHDAYFGIHGYLSIIICLIGIVSNLINIAVLTQKTMRTPTNAILTALAAVDAVVMLVYVPFSLHQYLLKPILHQLQLRSFAWMLFIFFTINFMIFLHTISVWLTITLAVFRCVAVLMPSEVQKYCSMKRAIWAITSSFAVTAIVCIPSYLSIQIKRVSDHEINQQINAGDPAFFDMNLAGGNDSNIVMYRIDESDLSKENGSVPRLVSFYAFSVFAKLVPCFVLSFFSLVLVRALMEVERRKFNLKNPNGINTATSSGKAVGGTTAKSGRRYGTATNSSFSVAAYSNRDSIGETSQFLSAPPANNVAFNNSRASTPLIQRNNSSGPAAVPPAVRPLGRGRDRTTRMLLVILVSFLITEFPSGLLALLSCFSKDFFEFVYVPLGDLMDILALFNSSANFIIYCSMSRMFRKTFSHTFFPPKLRDHWKRWKVQRRDSQALAQTQMTTMYNNHPEPTITYFPQTNADNNTVSGQKRCSDDA